MRELYRFYRKKKITDPGIYVAHDALGELGRELSAIVAPINEFALFGSATLVLRGVINRPIGDIDLFCSKAIWGKLLPRPRWTVLTPKAGDPPILSMTAHGIECHAFFAWSDPAVEIDVPKLIAESEIVNGWPCATLKEVLRHKVAASEKIGPGNKHEEDIEMIEARL